MIFAYWVLFKSRGALRVFQSHPSALLDHCKTSTRPLLDYYYYYYYFCACGTLACLFQIWTVHPIFGGCAVHKIFSRRVLRSLNNFSAPSSSSCRSIKYELVPQKRIKGKLKDERSLEQIRTAAPWTLQVDNVSTEIAIGKCTLSTYSSNLICCFWYMKNLLFLQNICNFPKIANNYWNWASILF